MKYHVEEIKHSEYSSEFKVLDENNVQQGESFWTAIQAQWKCEDLNAGKKPLTEEEAHDLAFGLLGEIEEAHETGKAQPVEEKVTPVRADHDDVTISGKNEVGSIIEYCGESWLVTHCYEETGHEPAQIRDEMDEVPPQGWYSELFRVRDNLKAIQVVAEQHQDGQARFTGPHTVKFADEQYAVDMRHLAYSPEIGLYEVK